MRFDRLLPLLVPFASTILAAGAPRADAAARAVPAVELAAYEKHVARLASDEFEGRKPATRGGKKTVAYLVNEFTKLELAPGNGQSFVQPVPIVEITAGSDATLSFATPKGVQDTRYAQDSIVWTKRVVRDIELEDSEVVFVGHGIVAPEYGWNDYAGVDMRGKTALILINDPGFATHDDSLFRGRALTYYGRWTYKFEEAARQGAAAALIIHETEPASYGWSTVVNSWDGPQLDKATADGNAGRVEVEGWITLERAQQLLSSAGRDYATLKTQASQRGFEPVPTSIRASASLRNAIRRSTSNNVIATIPGSKRPDEYVVYMAHWDHLGRTLGESGDTIFNGAVDNATGTAGLLVIAAAFKEAPLPPERTVVFLALTAEEDGLLGSAYYVDNPVFPLSQTVAALNMDAIYFGGPTRDVSVIGYGASELEGYLETAARSQDRVVRPDPKPEQGSFYRSDHFNFAKYGVPALYFKKGIDDREHGAEWGRQQDARFVAERYHQVGDNYTSDADLRGGAEDLDLLYALGRRLANETAWPNWYRDNEFRAIRDRSRANSRDGGRE